MTTQTNAIDQRAEAICRAAQLDLTAPPLFWEGGYTCFVASRPKTEATLRQRLREAGAVLVSYGSNFSLGYERQYVRFLVNEPESDREGEV